MIISVISTVIKTVYVAFRSQPIQVSFKNKNSSTLETLGSISQLSIPNVNLPGTSTDNAIAYRPYFNDVHNSNLAIVFLNLEAAFPCLRDTDVMPVCNLFTLEEDGFLGGRSLVQAADLGNDFRIFSNSRFVKTFGFGFTGCRTFATSCVPVSFERSLVCLLPRNVCT